MKKNFFPLFLFFFLLLLTGCSSTDLSGNASIPARSAASYGVDQGRCVYEKNGLLYVQDVKTNQSTILCSKPDCEHKPYDADENPNPECEATVHSGSCEFYSVAIQGQTVYEWMDTKNANESVLYKMKLGESGWKKVGVIPYRVDKGCSSYYIDGYAYLAGFTEECVSEKNINDVKQSTVIVKVNLKTAETEEISDCYTAMYHARMKCLQYSDGKLCYAAQLLKDGYNMEDIATSDTSIFSLEAGVITLSKQETKKVLFQSFSPDEFLGYEDGKIYYLENGVLTRADIDGNQKEGIKELQDGETCTFYDSYGILLRTEDHNYEFYSFAKKKWIRIKRKLQEDLPEEYQVTDEPVSFCGNYVWINRSVLEEKKNQLWMISDWIYFPDYIAGERAPKQEDEGGVKESVLMTQKESTPKKGKEPKLTKEYYKKHWGGKTILNWWCNTEMKPHMIAALNDALVEKGADYVLRVKMVTDYDEDYRQSLINAKKKKEPLDIIAVGTQFEGNKEEDKYVEAIHAGLLTPLSDYLQSEEGKAFYDMYTKTQWKDMTVDGKIYSYDWRKMPIQDLCVAVNKKYLEKYNLHVDENTTLEELADMAELVAKGEKNVYFYPLYWAIDTTEKSVKETGVKEVIDLMKNHPDTFKFHNPYMDASEFDYFAKFCKENPNTLSENKTLDYIPNEHTTKIVKINIATIPYISIHNGLTGVASWSEHKKEAMNFLALCNTDPDIATILQYGEEGVDYVLKNGRVENNSPEYNGEANCGNKWITPPYDLEPLNKEKFYYDYIRERIK